jgi:hypothetical protein
MTSHPSWQCALGAHLFNQLFLKCTFVTAVVNIPHGQVVRFSDKCMSVTGFRSNFNFPICDAMDKICTVTASTTSSIARITS